MSTSFPNLIAKKRNGYELEDSEIKDLVNGIISGNMADSQIGAMLMAMYCKKLSEREVAALTSEMKNTGDTLQWPNNWSHLLVDKHSTGGVGDKTSLVLAPTLAAWGLKVPMISGRGLEHTGGTLDKLEAIPGYRVALTFSEMEDVLESVGCFIAGQTQNICPADKKTYAIRDVTATVDDIGLITASIVSKKAAENISALVLDVKTGSGAFLKNETVAAELAQSMISCCSRLGIKAVALLTEMDSPIGNMVGHALEVIEAIRCLQGQGPDDFLNLTINLGGHLLHTGGYVDDVDTACNELRHQIESGAALSKFCSMLKCQGVKEDLADSLCNPSNDPSQLLPQAKFSTCLKSPSDGFIRRIDAMDIALAAHKLGAGRNVPGEPINLAVGFQLLLKPGDQVIEGQNWIKVYHDEPLSDMILCQINKSLEISKEPVQPRTTRVIRVMK